MRKRNQFCGEMLSDLLTMRLEGQNGEADRDGQQEAGNGVNQRENSRLERHVRGWRRGREAVMNLGKPSRTSLGEGERGDEKEEYLGNVSHV